MARHGNDLLRIEVLKLRIEVDARNHDKEINKITRDSNQEIETMGATIEDLEVHKAKQDDEIKQLKIDLQHKDNSIEMLRNEKTRLARRSTELCQRIDYLEGEIKKHDHAMRTVEQKNSKCVQEMIEKNEALKIELDKAKSLKENIEEIMRQMEYKMVNKQEQWEEKMQQKENEAKKREQQKENEAKKREQELMKGMQNMEEKLDQIMKAVTNRGEGTSRNQNVVIMSSKEIEFQTTGIKD